MTISIITATYNSGKTLCDTLDSVLRQTYSDYEHIIIDGASSDDTLAIVREYEARYKGRLSYISEPDKGLYDAMNKGLALAAGNVVGILNSDDFYTSDDILERVAAAMSDTTIDAVYGDIHFVHNQDLTKCTRRYSSKSFRRWQMRLGFMPAHPSFYCRRSVYLQYGFFDTSYRIAADFESLLRFLFVHRIRTRYLPVDFVTMRTGGASTSGIKSYKQSMKERLKAFKKNQVYSNFILVSLMYIYKLILVLYQRVQQMLLPKQSYLPRQNMTE